MKMIYKADIAKFSEYTVMRFAEDHIRLAVKQLRKYKGRDAQARAQSLEYALWLLNVKFPECFPNGAAAGMVVDVD